MLRTVSDVANINYWLRCQGDILDNETARTLDLELRKATETSLGGAVPDHSWWQAELAVKHRMCTVQKHPIAQFTRM